MYKTLIVALIALLCVGCGRQSDGKSSSERGRCIRGVVYYESGYKLAPAFKPDVISNVFTLYIHWFC